MADLITRMPPQVFAALSLFVVGVAFLLALAAIDVGARGLSRGYRYFRQRFAWRLTSPGSPVQTDWFPGCNCTDCLQARGYVDVPTPRTPVTLSGPAAKGGEWKRSPIALQMADRRRS